MIGPGLTVLMGPEMILAVAIGAPPEDELVGRALA